MRGRVVSKPVGPVSLNLQMEDQLQDLWCWAAVSVSVKRFYQKQFAMRQCEQAGAQLQLTTCCDDPQSCNREWRLKYALEGLGVLREMIEGPVPLSILRQEIGVSGRPVGCCIDWDGGGGHFVCIDGYDDRFVAIKDPKFGSSRIPYEEFAEHYLGRGKWSWTYLTKP
jgi:ABC-type bacteriocin/lantibiotic exporter with double-glycine peptidase domain